jgi:hypothetical protein
MTKTVHKDQISSLTDRVADLESERGEALSRIEELQQEVMYAYMYVYMCMDVWMHGCMYVYMYVCVCVYVCMYVCTAGDELKEGGHAYSNKSFAFMSHELVSWYLLV